jgi:hypothetical protein
VYVSWYGVAFKVLSIGLYLTGEALARLRWERRL